MSERLAPAASLLRLTMDEPRLAEAEVTRERDLMAEEARQVADELPPLKHAAPLRWDIQRDMQVAANPAALKIVLGNLMGNAAKFTRDNTQPRIRVGLRDEGMGLVRVSVQDNGVGFEEPQMYREGSHGLMGIRERAYMLGGELKIGNARGGGGQLTVRLPLRRDAAGAAAGASARARASIANCNRSIAAMTSSIRPALPCTSASGSAFRRSISRTSARRSAL